MERSFGILASSARTRIFKSSSICCGLIENEGVVDKTCCISYYGRLESKTLSELLLSDALQSCLVSSKKSRLFGLSSSPSMIR
jgi:hypothetical protein